MATRLKTKWIQDLAITTAKLDATSVTAAKLGSDVAGNGLTGGDGAAIAAQADGTSLSVGVSGIKVTDGGISNSQLSTAVAGDGLSGGGGAALSVNVDDSSIEISGDTLQVKASGVTNDMLAGSIADTKLSQITTADKVAASAVEDKFLRNDSDDTSTGRIQAEGFDANSNVISRVADATAMTDAVNYGQLNEIATAGRAWKEPLLYQGQLFDGTTNSGIAAANVLVLSANLVTGDTITLNDGTGSENYIADTDFAVGIDINATLANLETAIDGGAIAISATSGLLDSLDATNNVLIVWQDTIGEPTRVYGDAAAATRVSILPTSVLYSGIDTDLVALPTSDPAATNFGFSRASGDLATNETHLSRENDSAYTWDEDADIWNMTGASSIPYASKTDWGKVKISDGIAVSSGEISVNVDGSTIEIDTDIVQVKDDGITAAKINADVAGVGLGQDATGGLKVNVDDSSLEVSSDTVQVKADGIVASMINSDVAGAGITQDGTGGLQVNADDSSLEVAGDVVQIKDDGVTAAKVNADVAGVGLTQDGTGALQVNVDDSSLEVTSDTVQVKDDGITAAKVNADVAGVGLTQDGTGALTVNVDNSTLEVTSDTVQVKADGITSTEIANGAVGFSELKTDATSALEDSGSDVIRVKVKSAGGVLIDSDGLYLDQSQVSAYRMEEHTITSGEESAQEFQLGMAPSDGSQVTLVVLGGVAQNNGTDYSVTDTTVAWSGLGLDGFIEENEVIQLTYPV